MPKLPHLPRRERPTGEAARLSRWFREWNLAQRLWEELPEEYSQALHSPPVSERPHTRDLSDLVAPFDTNVKVGQIRILHGGMFAEMRRPMHVLILDEWPPREIERSGNRNQPEAPPNVTRLSDELSDATDEQSEEKSYLVAPFGDYQEPATTTEWLTGRDGPLRVLCLWNTRDYPARWLELGWVVDELNERELADAWEVFRHATTGVPLSDRLREQVGAPIVHPRDPRLAYQAEEARLFTIVPESAEFRWRLEEDAAKSKKDETGQVEVARSEHSPARGLQPAAAASGREIQPTGFAPPPPFLKKREEWSLSLSTGEPQSTAEKAIYMLAEIGVRLVMRFETNREMVSIKVRDLSGNPSPTLDGARVLNPAGAPVCVIAGQAARVPWRDLAQGLAISTSDGRVLVPELLV